MFFRHILLLCIVAAVAAAVVFANGNTMRAFGSSSYMCKTDGAYAHNLCENRRPASSCSRSLCVCQNPILAERVERRERERERGEREDQRPLFASAKKQRSSDNSQPPTATKASATTTASSSPISWTRPGSPFPWPHHAMSLTSGC